MRSCWRPYFPVDAGPLRVVGFPTRGGLEVNVDEFLTTKEVAELLKLRPQSLRARRLDGTPPLFYKVGNRVRYSRRDVEAYLAENHFRSTSEITVKRGAA